MGNPRIKSKEAKIGPKKRIQDDVVQMGGLEKKNPFLRKAGEKRGGGQQNFFFSCCVVPPPPLPPPQIPPWCIYPLIPTSALSFSAFLYFPSLRRGKKGKGEESVFLLFFSRGGEGDGKFLSRLSFLMGG